MLGGIYENHCAFSKNHSCPLWTDYELTCYELEEANSLCHGNWIEIERQYKYIQTLQKILSLFTLRNMF
ncbi:MAG: mobility-associated LCxxNW protein [Dorea sp.]